MSEPGPPEGMSLIVKTVSHWLKAFLLLFGIYVVLYGHLTPGGGFPGGVIVACAFILITLAEGERLPMQTLPSKLAGKLDSVGALVFLGMGLLGLLFADVFLENFLPLGEPLSLSLATAGTIPVINIGIGLKVSTSLFLVFNTLAVLRVVRRNGNHEMIRKRGER